MNPNNIFITGIGTDVGKTLAAAIIAEALEADYWKPVQAGYENGTDSEWVRKMVSAKSAVHPELYKLKLPASPHIAAREEGFYIDTDLILTEFLRLSHDRNGLVIEGAGGLLVPLNENEKVIDLVKKLNAAVVIVSRNYLGSINHSLLTAEVLKAHSIPVKGWLFNDNFMEYEQEISRWSGYPILGSIPHAENADRNFILQQAKEIKPYLLGSV